MLTQADRSKGGRAVASRQPPDYCPRCKEQGVLRPMGNRRWHSYLGHLGLHGLADNHFGGDLEAAQTRLRRNGQARQDPAPWNGAMPRYKPVGQENGCV